MRPSIISSGLFEELESRRLLSGASIDASGTLLVSGSRARDRIAITLSPADPTKLNVVINGHLQTFDVAAITNGVKFFGKAGNDDFAASDSDGEVDDHTSDDNGDNTNHDESDHHGDSSSTDGSGGDSTGGSDGSDDVLPAA